MNEPERTPEMGPLRILVASAEAWASDPTLREALVVAAQLGGEVHVLHIVPEDRAGDLRHVNRCAHRLVQRIGDFTTELGHKVGSLVHVRGGDPVERIMQLSELYDPTLVVLPHDVDRTTLGALIDRAPASIRVAADPDGARPDGADATLGHERTHVVRPSPARGVRHDSDTCGPTGRKMIAGVPS